MKFIDRKEIRHLVGFNDLTLRLIFMPLFSIFFPILVFKVSPFEYPKSYLICVLISLAHILVFWSVDFWVVIYFRKKFQKIEEYRKRIIYQAVALILITLGLSLTTSLIEICLEPDVQQFDVPFFYKFMAGIITTTIIVSFYESVYAFQLFKRGLVKNQELQRRNTQAQLESLKNQVNPHFLFNSLNTLISVIPEDSDTAVRFAENLSRVYRYILEIKDRELITVKEELNCIESYQYLLSIRFGDHIRFEFEGMDEIKNKFIVPISLQLLIENAIKHNVVSKSRPLTISISADGDRLKVCNNLQLKTQKISSTGVGLDNIRKRYKLLSSQEIEVSKTDTIFCVSIPCLTLSEVK